MADRGDGISRLVNNATITTLAGGVALGNLTTRGTLGQNTILTIDRNGCRVISTTSTAPTLGMTGTILTRSIIINANSMITAICVHNVFGTRRVSINTRSSSIRTRRRRLHTINVCLARLRWKKVGCNV